MTYKKQEEVHNLVEKNNLVPNIIKTRKAWTNYRREVRNNTKRTKINTEPEFSEIVRECLKTIAYLWTNSTGGIYVKNVGYFTLLRPSKKFQREGNKEYINNILRTNGYSYLLTHITHLKKTDSFGGFKLRRANYEVKMDVRKNIIKGRRYTINSILIKEYIKRKTYL